MTITATVATVTEFRITAGDIEMAARLAGRGDEMRLFVRTWYPGEREQLIEAAASMGLAATPTGDYYVEVSGFGRMR